VRTSVALVLLLVGCGGIDPSVRARERAIEVLHCEEVEMVQREEARWYASGCERHADIACTTGSLEPTCIQVRALAEEAEHWAHHEEETSGSEEPMSDEELAVLAAADESDLDPEADEGLADDAPAALPDSSIEATIRRGLDARRADVLACTGRTASVVRVRYDHEGALTISLAGDLEGSPEEGCVRAALSGVHVAGGESGTVLHLLRGPD
jgi:hypothetical protein